MVKKIYIIGSSGHAKVIIDIFETMPDIEICGLIDSYKSVGESTLNYRILGGLNVISEINFTDNQFLFIAVGDNWSRCKLYKEVIRLNPNTKFINAIHPKAIISKHAQLGIGVAIMPGVVVNSSAKIEDFVILNTNSIVEHDCLVKEFASLAPSVALGGNVEIGKFTALSLNTCVKQKIKIGDSIVVGSSSYVNKEITETGVYFGTPAKFVRTRANDDSYL